MWIPTRTRSSRETPFPCMRHDRIHGERKRLRSRTWRRTLRRRAKRRAFQKIDYCFQQARKDCWKLCRNVRQRLLSVCCRHKKGTMTPCHAAWKPRPFLNTATGNGKARWFLLKQLANLDTLPSRTWNHNQTNMHTSYSAPDPGLQYIFAA
jgi:hypothetical protein